MKTFDLPGGWWMRSKTSSPTVSQEKLDLAVSDLKRTAGGTVGGCLALNILFQQRHPH